MKLDWLNKQNNKELIVFFSGWGSILPNEPAFGSFDIIMVHDYCSFEPINLDFSFYEKKYLICWSLGVYICNFYYDTFKNFDNFTAINGTLNPIDDNFGIPVNAYNLTIKNFNELTCNKFVKKIGTNNKIKKNIETLKQELISIKNLKPENFFNFTKAIISTKDKIFPYENMKLFWKSKNVKIQELEAPHYMFDIYSKWSDFI